MAKKTNLHKLYFQGLLLVQACQQRIFSQAKD